MNIEKIKGVPENIKALRKTTGFTQEKMSEELGISYSHYSKIESGDVQPGWELLLKISNYFDVPFDFIVKDSGYKRSSDYAKSEMIKEIQNMDEKKSELLGEVLSYIYLKIKSKHIENNDC
jgi:transcriptional regulator with XRE-family HTH domain